MEAVEKTEVAQQELRAVETDGTVAEKEVEKDVTVGSWYFLFIGNANGIDRVLTVKTKREIKATLNETLQPGEGLIYCLKGKRIPFQEKQTYTF